MVIFYQRETTNAASFIIHNLNSQFVALLFFAVIYDMHRANDNKNSAFRTARPWMYVRCSYVRKS